MITDGNVVGVIQVSRKGTPGTTIGPDFRPRDLVELMAVGSIVGRYVGTLPFAWPAPPKAPAHPAKP